MYQACNVYTVENGKYVIVPSEWVDDISVLKDQFEYLKLDYFKIVNPEKMQETTKETDLVEESMKLTKRMEA